MSSSSEKSRLRFRFTLLQLMVVVAVIAALIVTAYWWRLAREIAALKDRNASRRAAAAKSLGEFGDRGHVAVPMLVERLGDTSRTVRGWSAHTLEGFGEESVPALVEALLDDKLRDQARQSLADIGTPAVPALIEALSDEVPVIQHEAAFALAMIGPEAHPAIPALAKAVRSEDDELRARAVKALAEIDQKSLSTALELLRDDDPEVRWNAASILSEMFRTRQASVAEASQAVPALATALSDPDSTVKVWAARALGAIGPGAVDATPALTRALSDTAKWVPRAAEEALRAVNRSKATDASDEAGPMD